MAYQEQFETLMAKISRLLEEFFVQCFISGLNEAIKNQVIMFQLNTLSQTTGLALLQEGTMEAILKEVKASNESEESTVNSMGIRMNQNTQLPPIKRISATKIQDRWDKSLCYYCDERYEPSHKYKRKQIFLLDGHESKVEAIVKLKIISRRMILWFQSMQYLVHHFIKP